MKGNEKSGIAPLRKMKYQMTISDISWHILQMNTSCGLYDNSVRSTKHSPVNVYKGQVVSTVLLGRGGGCVCVCASWQGGGELLGWI